MINNQERRSFSFAGHDTVDLANTFGTPLYVLSEDMIRQRCRADSKGFLINTQALPGSLRQQGFFVHGHVPHH
jgi:diaminopimelate decarboxylase